MSHSALPVGLRSLDTPRTPPRCPGHGVWHAAVAMPTSRYFEPLRHRDFALLWSGQAISQLGDGVFTVTLAIEVLRIDQHALALSYVLAARLLPAILFTLGGGVIVDRVPRRLAMLASDIARGAAVAVITVL